MLTKLYIQNFALIESLEIDFDHGLNILTGETGAGKSIIIDAVGICIGRQGYSDFIRSGTDKALVEAVFDIHNNHKVFKLCKEYGYTDDPDEPLILTRELVKSGKNICRINGRQVSLSVYRDVARNLVDIYGQHHQQSLLDPENHILLLDEFGGQEIIFLKNKISEVYGKLCELKKKYNDMKNKKSDQARMADLYKFQLEEIDNSKLVSGEDIELEKERKMLANADKMACLTRSVYEILYEGVHHKPVSDLLGEAVSYLSEAASLDETLFPIVDTLQSILYQVEEISRDINSYASDIDADHSRLESVESRINLINQLKKKYGNSIDEILNYRNQISSSLEQWDNSEHEIQNIVKDIDFFESEYNKLADKLTMSRKNAAELLKKQITGELRDLNMPHVTFDVNITEKKEKSNYGKDNVEFLISPNRGEPLKPLAKIVSGGEVSRIMLSFKTILSRVDLIPTMIFDEVDAGIGGIALQSVAKKLSLIGKDKQVICITHSPQIAACANNHFKISKRVSGDRTLTLIEKLSDKSRIDEIARMLAGGNITSLSKKHAQELLKQFHL